MPDAPPTPRTMRDRLGQLVTDRPFALDLGSLLVSVGIGLFDYRLGIIALGGTIAAAALYGMQHDARKPPRS